jgi:hypothetical protein
MLVERRGNQELWSKSRHYYALIQASLAEKTGLTGLMAERENLKSNVLRFLHTIKAADPRGLLIGA